MNKIRMIMGNPKSGKTYFANHLPLNLTLDFYDDNSITGDKIVINSNTSILGSMNMCVIQLISNDVLKNKFTNITFDGFDIFYSLFYKEYNDIVSRKYWEQNISEDIFQKIELKVFEWFSTLLSAGYSINLIVGKTTDSKEIDDIFRSIGKVVSCFDRRYNIVDAIHCFFNEDGEHMVSINKEIKKFDDSLF